MRIVQDTARFHVISAWWSGWKGPCSTVVSAPCHCGACWHTVWNPLSKALKEHLANIGVDKISIEQPQSVPQPQCSTRNIEHYVTLSHQIINTWVEFELVSTQKSLIRPLWAQIKNKNKSRATSPCSLSPTRGDLQQLRQDFILGQLLSALT